MRILSVYYTHKPGGFCKRLYRLLNALSQRGHEVHYLALDTPPSAALDVAVNFHKIPFFLSARKGLIFWLVFTLCCPLYLLIKGVSIRPDRIFVFGPYYAVMTTPLRAVLRTPLVLFLRAGLSYLYHEKDLPLKRAIVAFFNRLGLRAATSIVCQSESMKGEAESLLPRARSAGVVTVLPNDVPPAARSIRLPASQTGAPKPLTALWYGLFVKSKNLEYLLHVFHEPGIKECHEKFRLILAGSGPELEPLKKKACEMGLMQVEFPGWQDDPSALFSQADLFVLPSSGEGMPNSLLEALGAGLPVLASDIPELREILFHDELLFNSREPEHLAAKLRSAAADRSRLALWKSLSGEAAARYSFDWDEKAVALICAALQ